jgi:hypothetical protein
MRVIVRHDSSGSARSPESKAGRAAGATPAAIATGEVTAANRPQKTGTARQKAGRFRFFLEWTPRRGARHLRRRERRWRRFCEKELEFVTMTWKMKK